MRLINSLCLTSPGIIGNCPLSAFAKASCRKSKLKSASRFTPPWHVMQRLLSMGLTWVLKSMEGDW